MFHGSFFAGRSLRRAAASYVGGAGVVLVLVVASLVLALVPLPVAQAAAPIRINTGGAAQTVNGVSWSACTSLSACSGYVTGGYAYTQSPLPTISGPVAPANQAIYQSEWTGGEKGVNPVPIGAPAFTFTIPVSNGTYQVRLHFAELNKTGAGQRVFDVNIEGGTTELTSFDVFVAAGGLHKAIVREFTATIADGNVTIAFIRQVENAKISAIEIIPLTSSTATPTRTPMSSTATPMSSTATPTSSTATPTRTPGPSTGGSALFAWRTLTPAPQARFEAQGAAVNGKLYVLGGFYASSPIRATRRSDVYDPATNTWQRIADMPETITHAAQAVDGETIYLIGGYVGDHPGPSTARVWKYNTRTNTWSAGPSLPAGRGAGAAVRLGRNLHFFGGATRTAGTTDDTDRANHYVLALDGGTQWTSAAPLPNPRNHLAGVALNGKLYAIGGQYRHEEGTTNQNQVDVYDPVTKAWTRAANLPVPRGHISASTFVMDGRIIVLGGSVNNGSGGASSADVTAYDPQANLWLKLPSLPSGRKTPVADAIGGRIVVSTGNGSGATSTTWSGALAGSWEAGAALPVALGEVASGIIGNQLYVVGEGNAATLSYNLGTGAWRSVTSVAQRPFVGHHHAAEVVGGKWYLLGGLGTGAGKVQIYNPATNGWTVGANMPFAAGSSASAVIGGQIYVAGGIVGSSTTAQVARYNPATNSWTSLAPMPQGRNHAAAATDGQNLYVFGGRGPGSGDGNTVANGFDTVQIYDPATNTWRSGLQSGSTLAPLPQARGGMGKAVYAAGEFYVIGGETQSGAGATANNVYHRVDIYNPRTNTWRLGAGMPTARHGIFPLLIAGRIYVAGGGVRAANSSSTVLETYNMVSPAPAAATDAPTAEPTLMPTATVEPPTAEPTLTPTATVEPTTTTDVPTAEPTLASTATDAPTAEPTLTRTTAAEPPTATTELP